jgi:fibronectin-binding autotransporter adhesin
MGLSKRCKRKPAKARGHSGLLRAYLTVAMFLSAFSVPGVSATSIWDGEASSANITAAQNWVGNTAPGFTGTETLVFGIGGQSVVVNINANIAGLTLNRSDNMNFFSINNGFLTVGSGGILALPSTGVSATYTLPSPVVLSADQTWNVENQPTRSTTLSVGGIGGNFNLSKSGSGLLTLSGNGSRAGDSVSTTLNGGTLRLQAASALNSSALAPLFLNGGELRLATNANTSFNGTNITVGGDAAISTSRSSGSGTRPVHTVGPVSIGQQQLTIQDRSTDSPFNTGSAVVQTGSVTLTGNSVFNVVKSTFADTILKLGAVGESGGTQGFTKTGNGTLELAAGTSHTGNTTVSGGLLLANSNATSTTVNVQSGGTLGGNGTVGGVRVSTGGTISPGNSPGNLTVAGDATWEGGSNYNWQVASLNENASNQTSKGINWDYFSVNGTLNLSGLNATPMNFNLWSLSSLSPETNGAIPGWPTAGNNTWAFAGASGGIRLNGTSLLPNTNYSSLFNINTAATNGTAGWSGLLPMTGSFQIVTLADANTLYLYASAAIPEPGQLAASALLLCFAAGYWFLKRRRGLKKPVAVAGAPPA